jgi:hypothetical protein
MLALSQLFNPSITLAAQNLTAPNQVPQIMAVPVVAQETVAVVPQPTVQQVVQPIVQPVVQPVIQSVVQPASTTTAPQLVQPIVQPIQLTASIPQIITQPVVPIQKPLTPSPKYESYIPPTPMPQSLANEIGPKVYQFYQYVPVQQTTPSVVNASIQQGPAFSTITTPVQNLSLVGVPQYTTLSYV